MSKTIFVTVSRGSIARNILNTGVLEPLLQAGHKIVLLTHAHTDEEFRATYGREGIVFEPMFYPKRGFLDRLFIGFHRGLIFNATNDIVARYGTYHASETSTLKWVLQKTVFTALSKLRFLRDAVRWLDERLHPDTHYQALFDAYHPDLVFSTNIMEDPDSFVIRAAKARNITTIGMPKSWDNLSKMFLRSKPDLLIVWSPYMEEEAIKFQNFHKKDIFVSGIPQFDVYATKKGLPSREEFLRSFGADPAKKTVLFASEAKLSPPDPEFVDMIGKAIADGRLEGMQMIVRPHFGFRNDVARFTKFSERPGVFVDVTYRPKAIFYDEFDYSVEHWHRLACSLLYADVVVTTFSTMTLDATACGKPVVNVMFDGYTPQPYGSSILRWYDSEHYRPIVKMGAAIPATSEAELMTSIQEAVRHPDARLAERARLLEHFVGPLDGRSASRLAERILLLCQS